ncbi:hypothetical protein FHT67_000615 [Paenibacillus sp. BK720]|nr:hypothetical protein [Paenibacillus sp. BK720]
MQDGRVIPAVGACDFIMLADFQPFSKLVVTDAKLKMRQPG